MTLSVTAKGLTRRKWPDFWKVRVFSCQLPNSSVNQVNLHVSQPWLGACLPEAERCDPHGGGSAQPQKVSREK